MVQELRSYLSGIRTDMMGSQKLGCSNRYYSRRFDPAYTATGCIWVSADQSLNVKESSVVGRTLRGKGAACQWENDEWVVASFSLVCICS